MKKEQLTQQSQASRQRRLNHYTNSGHGALAMARLADDIRRAQFIGVSTAADTELLHRYLTGFQRLVDQRDTMPTRQWLAECNDVRELAHDIVSRLISGKIELRGVI